MTVYIGNAVGDEHGKARGGEPGDQTGRELRIQPWYANKKGWRIFRPKSDEVAQKLAYNMRAACNNPNIGYDQGQRNTLYNVAKPFGFDCAEVAVPCECDCSSLVRVCLAYAGIKVKDFNTASEPARLLSTGDFVELTDERYTKGSAFLCTGDILCTSVKGHTAIVLNDGPKADRDPEPVPPEPKEELVEVIGKSVNVRNADSKKGRILFTAHMGDTFPYLGPAPSGWHRILAKGSEAFITGLPRYTRLV